MLERQCNDKTLQQFVTVTLVSRHDKYKVYHTQWLWKGLLSESVKGHLTASLTWCRTSKPLLTNTNERLMKHFCLFS